MKVKAKEPKSLSPEQALRKLFLTVFLRGQSGRGLTKETTPKNIFTKMWGMLGIYALMGFMCLFAITQPVLVLSTYQHALTFFMLGTLVASAAGEMLFNKEESEILMHRPVTADMLLRAKAFVLIQVTLIFALALNLVGMVAEAMFGDGGFVFPVIHLISMTVEALFCTGLIILTYQVCLKWFGREKLDSIMTSFQVLITVGFMLGSQLLPRAMIGKGTGFAVVFDAWYFKILPPMWFASIDDAVVGTHSPNSWIFAGLGTAITAVICYLAFIKLGKVYETGLQTLGEATEAKPRQIRQFRLLEKVSQTFPVSLFLKDPVSRSSFKLVGSYIARDRDTKLRLYPSIASMMIMPVVMLINHQTTSGSSYHPTSDSASRMLAHTNSIFTNVFVGMAASYLCIVPLMALNLIKYSQQWRAAELFLAAPISGPGPLVKGARVAVITLITVPLVVMVSIGIWALVGLDMLPMVLIGLIALPVYTYLPTISGNAVPLSNPLEESKKAQGGPIMMLGMFASFGLAGLAAAARNFDLFIPFLILEALISLGLCLLIRTYERRMDWRRYD